MQETEIREKLKGAAGRAEKLLGGYIGKYINGGRSGKISLKKESVLMARGILFGLTSFLFACARLQEGIRPFGTALLCASETNIPWIFAGLIVSAFTRKETMLINIVTYSAVLIMRILLCRVLGLRRGKNRVSFREPEAIRLATAASAGFISGLYGIFDGGFEKSCLYSALFLIALTPAVTFLYGGVSGKPEISGMRHDAGVLAMMFTLVLSLTSLTLFGGGLAGFSPAVIVSVFLTLCTAFSGGAFRGGIVGMICGLACGAELSPMLGIAGVIAGTLRHTGILLSMFAFCGSGAAFSMVTQGLSSFGGTIPDILWGAALFAPAAKLGLLPKLYPLFALSGGETAINNTAVSRVLAEGKRGTDTERRMESLSDALSSLSSVFYTLSNRITEPGIYEVRVLCEKSFKKYCEKCRMSTICWGREYERTADIMNKLANAVAKNGCADSEYIPDDFFKRCPNALKAISELNLSHARMLEAAAKENKTEVFALDYEAMAKLLESSCSDAAEEYSCDRELTEKVRRAAHDMNLFAAGIAVFGKRRKTIAAGGVDISNVSLSSGEMCREFEKACGIKLTVPEFSMDDDYVTMTSSSARVISVESARASLKKDNETVNGDSVACFSNKEDYFYSLISDGMGSGRDAAITSRITCIFLEKMLSAGNKKSIVLKMLNNFIRNKNLECFATVDLLEIDLLTASAGFIKSGAAASYVIRDKKLFKIASNSLPIGITREITAEEIRFELRAGDLIIMISDGISQSFEDGIWLADLLSSGIDPDCGLEDIAAIILEAAKSNNRRSDDMTVSAIRISEV